MKAVSIFIVVGVLVSVLFFYFSDQSVNEQVSEAEQSEVEVAQSTSTIPDDPRVADFEPKPNLIRVDSLEPGAVISSPLEIRGEARGYWFFEASFPIVLTNWDGLIIAEGYATAEKSWMTEDFVPFTAVLEFISPYRVGDEDFMSRGTLLLEKDNPSGLPENADVLELPVLFSPQN